MRLISIKIIVLALYASVAWADGTEVDVIEGNTVVPVINNNIRMVSEEVRMFEELETHIIEIPSALLPFIKKKEAVQTSKGMKVVADFIFENETDNEIKIKMGFPYYRGNSPSNFKAWIQNKPVNVEQGQLSEKAEVVIKDNNGIALDMYIWDILFSAHEQKKVKVEYYGGWGAPLHGKPYTYFIYITKTGALWRGNIGKADFYLKLTKSVASLLARKEKDFRLNIKPGNYILKDDQIEWHFIDWKPTENIGVALIMGGKGDKEFEDELHESERFKVLTKKEYQTEQKAIQILSSYFNEKIFDGDRRLYDVADIEKWKELHFADGIIQRLYIKALRNEIYARHGRIFITPDMSKIFESTSWYKYRQAFRESDLNEVEKKNVEFIFEYEKKMGWSKNP